MDTYSPLTVCIPDEGVVAEFVCRIAFRTETGGWHSQHNVLLVCPMCQRAWASISRGEPPLWPEAAPCPQCPSPDEWQFPVPGTLLFYHGYGQALDNELLEALPDVLLRREFALHLASYERNTKWPNGR